MLRALLLLVFLFTVCHSQLRLVSLNDLWSTKYISGYHLFPTHESLLYPHFLAIPSRGSATIHANYDGMKKISQTRVIHSVCSYRYVNVTYFVINEELYPGITELALNATVEELQQKANVMTFRLMKPSYFCFDPFHKTFNAAWQRPVTPLQHFEIVMQTLPEMIISDNALGRAGYYPDCWQIFDLNASIIALAIWRKGFGIRYRVQITHSLEDALAGMNGTDMRPVALSVLPKKNKDQAVWYLLWQSDHFSWRGRQIFKSQGKPLEWRELDEVITSQMRYYDIPSISICVFNNTEVLYEAAYGYSDIRQHKQANPRSEYRIASISKVITAMGIAKLVNKKLLSLDSQVFGEHGILKQYSVHESLKQIKVRHLLEHATGGWSHFQRHEFNRNESDHMTFVRELVTGYTIVRRPGGVFTYSNIGYMFLGRVIEQITNKTYEQFIQSELLKPVGIIAKVGDVAPGINEVTYYSQDNASPYNHWNPKLLDAATGWVFSAGQLAKLFAELEKGRGGEYSIVATRSSAFNAYGRGIQIGDDGSLYHTGSLAGSEAFAATRGAQVVILSNFRGRQHNIHTGWMQAMAKKLLDNINK